MNSGGKIWIQVIAALHLLKTDPAGLRGAVFRVRAGPVRDSLAKAIRKLAKANLIYFSLLVLLYLHPSLYLYK